MAISALLANNAGAVDDIALPSDATKYLDGTGAFTVPGGGSGPVTTTGSPATGQRALFSGASSIAGINAAMTPQGRVTLTSGVPWMKDSATAQTTVYYTPAVGNCVPIYNGTNWADTVFTELSQATTDSTKSPAAVGTYSNYDLFVWSDSGTLRCTRGPAWTQAQNFTVTIASPAVFSLTGHGFYEGMPIVLSTSGALPTGLTVGTTYFVIAAGLTANAFEVSATFGGAAINTSGSQSGVHTATQNTTVRGTGAGTTELEFINGILMNKNAITNGPGANRGTYVGTIRSNGSSQIDVIVGGAGAAGGESTVIGIDNLYNRSWMIWRNFDNTNSWNYTLAAYRIKDGNVANRIQFVRGWQVDGLSAINAVVSSNTSANIIAISGIGFDSMTGAAVGSSTGNNRASAGATFSSIALYETPAPLGFHYVAPLELSGATGTQTWYGDNGGDQQLAMFTLRAMF